MSKKTEKIRFILSILLTVLFLSTSVFSVLAKPDKTPVEDFQISEEEEEDEEEEEEKLTPEQIAAREAAEKAALEAKLKKQKELEDKVNELGKDNDAIVKLLTDKDNSEAVNDSEILLEKLVLALLNVSKPNYDSIKSYGDKLSSKSRGSSLGFYAQGLGLMYGKKPNLAKAMDLLGKAKNAKKPYKDASSAYTTCLIKRFGLYVGLAVLAIIGLMVAIIVKKIKAKKAASAADTAENPEDTTDIDLQNLLNEPGDGANLTNVANGDEQSTPNKVDTDSTNNLLDNKTESNNKPLAQEPKAETNKSINTDKNTLSTSISPNQALIDNKTSIVEAGKETKKDEQPSQVVDNKQEVVTNTASSAPAKKVVRVVKKVRVRKDANGNSYVVSEDTAQQPDSSQSNNTNIGQNFEDLENIRSISRPNAKPLPPVDTQLDILWGNLSRKAMQGHIGLMARKPDALSSSLAPTSASGVTSYPAYNSNENRINDIRFGDVSIDLSEEALKDDLVGKLKMLAITDSELRELFALKNPAHIPHLIEYIMTKPEPARLAFVAKELGNYPDPAVVDALSSLLYHEDERVVLAAIQGLEATKLPAAIIPLCPFLRADIPLYAQAARTAMSKFGAVKIMQALKDLPTFTDIKLKEAGIFVLSRMKGEPVEKILKTLLNDESSSVRIQTILAMSYQKNPVYIDALREFYRIANETEKSMTRKAIVYLNGFNK